MVGHETYAYDDLTVAENVRFATRAAGHSKANADAAIARVGLTDLAGVAHGRLSQGQRRRLSLAIALARDPRLLLLDEPHAGLDADGRAVVDEVLANASAEGRTVLSPRTRSTWPAGSRRVRSRSSRAGRRRTESSRDEPPVTPQVDAV